MRNERIVADTNSSIGWLSRAWTHGFDTNTSPARRLSGEHNSSGITCQMNLQRDDAVGLNAPRDSQTSPSATRILYLAHDLDDAAIWRRVKMLRLGGAEVTLAGFRRRTGALPEDALVLGQTYNAQMVQRIKAVLRQRARLNTDFADLPRVNAILCRNLEMLVLAVPLRQLLAKRAQVSLIYEVLDVHRLMVGSDWKAKALRWIERRLTRDVDRLIVSSPAFLHAHFEPYEQIKSQVLLVENKVVTTEPSMLETQPSRTLKMPLRIGWFGILRCAFSLRCLDALTRAQPGRYTVVLRGRPALDALPDFHDVVDANPDLTFHGPYSYPGDLAKIYGDIDLAWLVDRYDTDCNSDWLLPNRLYESGLNGVPPIGLAGTEVAERMDALGIGVVLEHAEISTVLHAMAQLEIEDLEKLRLAQSEVPRENWLVDLQEAQALVEDIAPHAQRRASAVETDESGVLIVIPTLNEADHIAQVIDGLLPLLERRKAIGAPTRVVVADGGSLDDTQDLVRARIEALAGFDIRLLYNPGRLQSAAVNMAVSRYCGEMAWLIRLDAHARYPEDYIDVLLQEAIQTGADSVVVAMRATGKTPTQRAIALTQNARLGNGGSAHRTGSAGRFVDHGHHALMRLEAFRTVGGYDERFSHNEDAELDLRLSQAGFQIWLTQRTHLDYLPRNTLGTLARQYLNFGRGRARTLLKHRKTPRLRQIAMIAVAPMAALAALAPLSVLFAIPAMAWVSACLIGALVLTLSRREPLALASFGVAVTMHLAWSIGFWRQLLAKRNAEPAGIMASPDIADRLSITTAAVGVCTFQRPALSETLRTLEGQVLPDDLELSIIVIDNDDEPSARSLVERFAALSRHNVIYRHAPARNISIARNAALDQADALGLRIFAFIDDDELAPADWLALLVARLAQGDADVVVGPIRAIYPSDTPNWMQRLRLHDTQPELGSDNRPIAGHSCNVIMNLGSPTLAGRRFDLERGISGGEDTAFFKEASEAGARLALAPQARLDERVTPARARFSWLLKRRFRMGQTHGSLLRKHKGEAAWLITLPVALAKVVYCGVLALVAAPFSVPRNANLLRGALHFGTVAALVGIRDVTIYGRDRQKPKDVAAP